MYFIRSSFFFHRLDIFISVSFKSETINEFALTNTTFIKIGCCVDNSENLGNMADVTSQRIYSAEQIVVPSDLPTLLKHYSKEVIRANPKDIIAFSAK